MKLSKYKFVQTAAVAAAIAALGSFGQAYAQDAPPPVGDAEPPVDAQPAAVLDAAPPAVASQGADSNTFNWKDVPANQQIVIDRAVFDQGGYQLYCHTGETIVIPFVDHNLYVMKFGRSQSGTYFVNDGSTPTLYVPEGGYLENSAADGAKWYPFPDTYTYTAPVYLGVAPTWDAYISMAWYPDMYCCGGYWCSTPYAAGVIFAPMPGFYVSIFDQPYYGWGAYRTYFYGHPSERVYFRTAPVFRYDHVFAREPASFGHARTFNALPSDRDAHFSGARPNPAFHSDSGRPSSAFGNARLSGTDSNRTAAPMTTHVWGSTAPGSHPAFGMRLGSDAASAAGESTRKPFGGLTSAPSNSTRSTWGDGSSHNWGSSSRSATSGSGSTGSGHSWSSSGGSGGRSESGGSSSHSDSSNEKDQKNHGK